MSFYDYERPAFAVDCVLLSCGTPNAPQITNIIDNNSNNSNKENSLYIRLTKRLNKPEQDKWSLLGAFVGIDETMDHAVERSVNDKGEYSADDFRFKQFHTFDTPGRDERWRVISTAYIGIIPTDKVNNVHSTDSITQWFKVDITNKTLQSYAGTENKDDNIFTISFDELAFDHGDILVSALQYIQDTALTTDIVFSFVPDIFTCKDISNALKAIYGKKIDNVQRRYQQYMIEIPEDELGDIIKPANRPPKFYKHKDKTSAQ